MTSLYVGNDIVDLTLKDNIGKSHDYRFLNRVFTASEQNFLNQSTNKDASLWKMWAAKEAAYKILKKCDPDLIFSHLKFVVTAQECQTRGMVKHHDKVISVRWEENADWVHCIAHMQSEDCPYRHFVWQVSSLAEHVSSKIPFSSRESASIYSSASRSVRVQTKKLLQKLGLEQVEIVRELLKNKFGPPFIMDSGHKNEDCDISMSHDGNFVASAIIVA